MNPPHLRTSQIAKLDIAVSLNRLSRVPRDLVKAQLFLDQANEAMIELDFELLPVQGNMPRWVNFLK